MEFALWFVHRVPYSSDVIVIIQADPTELVMAFDTFIKNSQCEKKKDMAAYGWGRHRPVCEAQGPRQIQQNSFLHLMPVSVNQPVRGHKTDQIADRGKEDGKKTKKGGLTGHMVTSLVLLDWPLTTRATLRDLVDQVHRQFNLPHPPL